MMIEWNVCVCVCVSMAKDMRKASKKFCALYRFRAVFVMCKVSVHQRKYQNNSKIHMKNDNVKCVCAL